MDWKKIVVNFLKEEEGVTGIEYGLLAALIGIAFSAGAILVGNRLDALLGTDVIAGLTP